MAQPTNDPVIDSDVFSNPGSSQVLKPLIITFVGLLVLVWGLTQFIVQTYTVRGDSMSPTLSSGDQLLIDKLSARTGSAVARGAVVTFVHKPADAEPETFIKRIVGIPGDTVTIADGTIRVESADGTIIDNFDALYGLALDKPDEELVATVDPKTVFVLGDNRIPGASLDSRDDQIGLVQIETITGRLFMRYFPLGR